MNKKLIKLTEQDLHKIVKSSVEKIVNEVSMKGKSGKEYSLHGNDAESWDIMSRLRYNNGRYHGKNGVYNASRDEKNSIDLDDKAHPNLRSRNNAKRIDAMNRRINSASKDIIAANESYLHRIVKESVGKILNEIGDTDKGQDALGQVYGRAIKRANTLGGSASRRLRKVAQDANDKAYSEAEKNGLGNIHTGPFDDGISKGYGKAFVKESVDDIDGHNEMWQSLYDAFNFAHNIEEGGDMYIKAFNNNIFPLCEKIDKTLGYRTPEYFKGANTDDLITDWGDNNYDI